MKTKNKIARTGRAKALVWIAAIVLLGGGLVAGFAKLRDLWLEQSVLTDMDRQVRIESGKMVKADALARDLGLKVGVNLGLIDFAARRASILKDRPILRDLTVRRHLPDRLTVTIEERVPLARLGLSRRRDPRDRVADIEGVVFQCARGTRLLPIIREANEPGTSPGHRLTGRARAALSLIEACRDAEFQEIAILDVDVASPDHLLATINTGSEYAKLKIAWEGMGEEPTPAAKASLLRQLRHLRDAIRSRVGQGTLIWNATDFSHPGRIYADTKGKL